MLKRANRLISNFEFNVVRKYGDHSNTGSMYLSYVRPTNYKGPAKVGFLIPNTYDKRAVQRNRSKRLLREVVANHLTNFKDDFWIVISPRQSLKERTYEELNTEFVSILQKVPFTR